MVETASALPPLQRIERYRQLAQEARGQAARCKGSMRDSYLTLADQWERLAASLEATVAKSRDE